MKIISNLYKVIFNKRVFKEYSKISIKNGLNQTTCVLSFDCDTPKDAEASIELIKILKKKKIPAVFAVPGENIIESKKTYAQIKKEGFEFINHGYKKHADFDKINKKYEAQTFYNTMSTKDVVNDIIKGHHTILEILGQSPLGFRAPHFGYFQEKDQLTTIYKTLSNLNYKYSSTTSPNIAFQKGALYKATNKITEFPVSGWFDYPYRILDSNSCLVDSKSSFSSNDYIIQFKKMVDFFCVGSRNAILNFYTDPAQIINFKGYFECLDYALNKNIKFSTYTDILKRKIKIYD